MFGMEITRDDLFIGEKVLISKNANSVIKLNDFGLKGLSNSIEKAMTIIGFAGKEAIGGQLHLTNYRLIFKSHPANRVKGKFSIFLNTIKSVKDTSIFISKKIEVLTISQKYEFVIWGVPNFMHELESAKQTIDKDKLKYITEMITKDYIKIGQGFEHFKELDILLRAIPKITEVIQDPLSLSSIINVYEIFEIIKKDRVEM
jgi:hypothetical protein